jgi:SAM-dependent methyltransferase
MELFFELFSGLPRQGPGNPDSTRRALSMLPPLGAGARVLDLGCGTGAQAFELARCSAADIVCLDLHAPFVAELNAKAAELGLAHRVRAQAGDMGRLDFPPESFDAIWSEGAIYNIGFDRGLAEWRGLLKPGGWLAVSELCWLTPAPPDECAAFFAAEYPAMRDAAANLAAVERSGYRPAGHFTLPPSAWWDEYYAPLERKIPAFLALHPGDAASQEVAGAARREIEMLRKYPDAYGYVFFAMRKAPGG